MSEIDEAGVATWSVHGCDHYQAVVMDFETIDKDGVETFVTAMPFEDAVSFAEAIIAEAKACGYEP